MAGDIVIAPGETVALEAPGWYRLVVPAQTLLMAIVGGIFQVNKSFPLPLALPALRRVAAKCQTVPERPVLVVGHTDTSGTPDINDPLSLERAESIVAMYSDDVNTWLGRYNQAAVAEGKWGDFEDMQMLSALPTFRVRDRRLAPIDWFQQSRGLTQDGIAGPETRRQLIVEYFECAKRTNDGTDVSNSFTAHGCGESFPVRSDGTTVDRSPGGNQTDALDRRVEFFIFSKLRGIQPAVPGTVSGESGPYLTWRRAAKLDERILLRLSGEEFRMRLIVRGKPLRNEAFDLFDEGALLASGTTTDEGDIVVPLYEGTRTLDLVLTNLGITRTFELVKQQEFPSASDLQGARLRLHRLGFLATIPQDPQQEALTRDAVARFKDSAGLPADGVRDAAFVVKLQERYGS